MTKFWNFLKDLMPKPVPNQVINHILKMVHSAMDDGRCDHLRAIFGAINPYSTRVIVERLDRDERRYLVALLGKREGVEELNYPETRMTYGELLVNMPPLLDGCPGAKELGYDEQMRDMASAIIWRAIKDRDVVPVSMLNTMGLAVMAATMNANTDPSNADYAYIDIQAIAERVKGGA